MATVYEVPLSAMPQTFRITLDGTDYYLTVAYRAAVDGGWTLDIADADKVPVVSGIPLVTGVDLLAQYKHLGFTGELYVQTENDPDAVPTFDNLGSTSHLYWVVR